ncbi:MAG: hypothetical protein AAF682_11630 [Planctomycetota bacterium]
MLRKRSNTLLLAPLLLLAPGAGAAAQGTLLQDEEFHYILMSNGGPGGFCPGPFDTSLSSGELELRADGTLFVAGFSKQVCADGTSSSSGDPGAGTYTLAPDGVASLLVDPPDPVELGYRFDHGVLISNVGSNAEPAFLVAVRKATTAPAVAGTYTVGRFSHLHGAGGLVAAAELGTLVVTAGGAWSETGQRHELSPTGTTNTTYSRSGTLTVGADGGLVVQPGARQGAITADGELLFWDEDAGLETGMTFATRQGGTHSIAGLQGAWEVTAIGTEQGPAAGLPLTFSFGSHLSADGAGTAVLNGSGAELSPSGSSTFPIAQTGVLLTDATGGLTYTASGTAVAGGLSAGERFGVLVDVTTPGKIDLVLLMRTCVAPLAYGAGLAGTGGVVPQLGSTGGLPTAGNAAFGLRVEQGVGGGAGLLVVTNLPAPGLPFAGGGLWVGGAPLLVQGFALGGAVGAAGAGSATVPLPVPAGSSLVGADLHAQGFVLDGALPGGLALTPGLAFEVCE